MLTTTNSQGVYLSRSGTSFATPVVTGSIALLVQWFKPSTPNYDGIKAAQDLLDTTYALGTCRADVINLLTVVRGKKCREDGNLDDTLGHGLLDIAQALAVIQEQNSPGVAMQAGAWDAVPRVHRFGSSLVLSTPFGDTAARLRSVLNNAIVVDELGRGHRFVLGSLVGGTAGVQTADLLFANSHAPSFSIDKTLANDKTLRFSFRQNTTVETSLPAYIEGTAQRQLFTSGAPTESLINLLADSPTLSVAYGITHKGASNKTAIGKSFVRLSFSDSALTGQTRDRPKPEDERGNQRLIRLSGEHHLAHRHAGKPSTRLRWQAALLSEDSETLGGANRGIYGFNHGAKTRAFSLGADHSLAHGLTLSADITQARTQAGQGGLITRWSNLHSAGWALSLTHTAPDAKTRTGLRLSQPLRTTSGTLDLHYPARYFHKSRRIEFDTARVGLRPSGRELRLELAQDRQVNSWLNLETRLLYRHEPNHHRSTPNEYGVGLGIRIKF